MKKIQCPECLNEIELENKEYKVGDLVECPYCGSVLEVAKVEDETIEVVLVEEEK